jgi:hypothetical protein
MASFIGALLIALAAGGFLAALAGPVYVIVQRIIVYLRGIYGRPSSTRKDSSER